MFDSDSKETAWSEKIVSWKLISVVSDDGKASSNDSPIVITLP